MRNRHADPEMDAQRKLRATVGLPMFAEANASADLDAPSPEEGARTVSRHTRAIQSVEENATTSEERLVSRVQALLRGMPEWSADTVRDLLNIEETPDTLAIRRRLSSLIVNGLRPKRKLRREMTRHTARSGREIQVWTCQLSAIDKTRDTR